MSTRKIAPEVPKAPKEVWRARWTRISVDDVTDTEDDGWEPFAVIPGMIWWRKKEIVVA